MIKSNQNFHQYTTIHPNAVIGELTEIGSHVSIDDGVIIGNRTSIAPGVRIGQGVSIGEEVQIGPNACILSSKFLMDSEQTNVGSQVNIGANVTIFAGIKIGRGATIESGSVAKHSIPSNAIVSGNPAVIIGYNGIGSTKKNNNTVETIKESKIQDLDISGCVLYRLPWVSDMRGDLSVAEYEKNIPFLIKRCFWVFNVPNEEIRGEHAHKNLHQFLICVHGAISVVVDDGKNRKEVRLDKPNIGLYIPPLIWGVQYKHTSDAVLVVFASDHYDNHDYIRDYDEFIEYIEKRTN